MSNENEPIINEGSTKTPEEVKQELSGQLRQRNEDLKTAKAKIAELESAAGNPKEEEVNTQPPQDEPQDFSNQIAEAIAPLEDKLRLSKDALDEATRALQNQGTAPSSGGSQSSAPVSSFWSPEQEQQLTDMGLSKEEIQKIRERSQNR